jgi:formate/nitrite transporter FocA (FNT family)
MAFVAMGFDHVIANMFFLPAAMFARRPGDRLGQHAGELGCATNAGGHLR